MSTERRIGRIQDVTLQDEKLKEESGILSPEEEAAFGQRVSFLEMKAAALEDENAELRQQLANLKKLVYGQKSEKTEVILENAEQLYMFNEAEENANKEVRERERTLSFPSISGSPSAPTRRPLRICP